MISHGINTKISQNRRMKLENQAVIEAIRSGSEKILFLIYEEFRNEFIQWSSYHYNISKEEAKDYFQEVILALYRNIKSGATIVIDTELKTYLFSIGKYLILKGIRHKSYEQEFLTIPEITNLNSFEDQHDHEHLVQLVKRIYKLIGSPCKEILEMHYAKRFDMESIANRMGYKNANVAKKKKYECIKQLEDRLKLSTLN